MTRNGASPLNRQILSADDQFIGDAKDRRVRMSEWLGSRRTTLAGLRPLPKYNRVNHGLTRPNAGIIDDLFVRS